MMNLTEASRLLGVTTARLRAWVAEGTAPDSTDLDGAPMFEMDALRAWIRVLPTVDGVPQLPDSRARRVLH